MKKLYIIFSNTIARMGGGQMYVRNKIVYMKKQGWEGIVFSSDDDEIIIPELKLFAKYIYPELSLSPMIYSKKTLNKVLNKLVSCVSSYDEFIIESSVAHVAYWGELLAQKLQCKNMVHLLDEKTQLSVPKEYLDFYRFKLERKELTGIARTSISDLFRNDIPPEKSCYLSSVCSNVIADYDININISGSDYTLGCIGRMQKEYVLAAAQAFIELAERYPQKKFTAVFIGDSVYKKAVHNIQQLFKNKENIELVITGYMYPISTSFIKKIDVFVSGSGSARASYYADKPTITVDINDLQAIGVMGYTTLNTLKRNDEKKIRIVDLMEKILFTDYLENYEYTPATLPDVDNILKTHIEFYENSDMSKNYYPVLNLNPAGIDKIKLIMCRLLSANGYLFIKPFYCNFKLKITEIKKVFEGNG